MALWLLVQGFLLRKLASSSCRGEQRKAKLKEGEAPINSKRCSSRAKQSRTDCRKFKHTHRHTFTHSSCKIKAAIQCHSHRLSCRVKFKCYPINISPIMAAVTGLWWWPSLLFGLLAAKRKQQQQ